MKVLFLDTGYDSTTEYFRKEREKNEKCIGRCLYKNKNSRILKIVQWIGINIFQQILYFIYGDWKKEINKYDMFIIPSRKSAKYATQYIKKHTDKRVIVWYWNLVTDKELDPKWCRSIGCETWSFDKLDCEKYQMKFGDTYYFTPDEKLEHKEKKYSVFYVGINRPGREEFLNRMGKYLNERNLMYKFNLTAMPNDNKQAKEKYAKRLDYNEIIEYINESDAILDLNREKQSGMTLRPMEAIFYGKKLITNNEYIKQYKAYIPENTFIIKENQIEGIEEFLKKEIKKVDENLCKHYSFSNWLQRIIDNKEADGKE